MPVVRIRFRSSPPRGLEFLGVLVRGLWLLEAAVIGNVRESHRLGEALGMWWSCCRIPFWASSGLALTFEFRKWKDDIEDAPEPVVDAVDTVDLVNAKEGA